MESIIIILSTNGDSKIKLDKIEIGCGDRGFSYFSAG
jgi:hypothetical protein